MKNYEDQTKADLAAEADRRGLVVTRGDGGEGGPLKEDYVKALTESDGPGIGTSTDPAADPAAGEGKGGEGVESADTAETASATGTPRAKVIGRMIACGLLEPGAPVTWGGLSHVMDIAENNSHGKNARAELDERWEALKSRKDNPGSGKDAGTRTLQGNRDTMQDSDFADQPVPEPERTAVFIKPKAKRS